MTSGLLASFTLVIPCFNEAGRLVPAAVEALASTGNVRLLLVDDGSTDGTRALLRRLGSTHANVSVLGLDHNVGKGEAVRAGLLSARRNETGWVGYVDADFAAPPSEIVRLARIADRSEACDVVMGARVAMLGRDIARSPFRHYSGRVFATLASTALDLRAYDTQCGVKFFRVGPTLDRALAQPFRSSWAFDVELLARLLRSGCPPTAIREEPLEVWHDIAGSRRSVSASIRATASLWSIRRDLGRWT
jgi:glycosyltransferase involved in cell wall biosynthesis